MLAVALVLDLRPREARRVDRAASERELRLLAGERADEAAGGRLAPVQVDHAEAAGVLRLGAADEAKQRGLGQVRRLALGDGEGAVRQQHEPRSGERLAG